MPTIKMARNGKEIGDLEVTSYEGANGIVVLSYKDSFGRSGDVSGFDYFEAFSKIRDIFVGAGVALLCKGSRLNVFPGGLESEQSRGEISYEEVHGDFIPVGIFEPSEISQLDESCTYEMQKEARRLAIRRRKCR